MAAIAVSENDAEEFQNLSTVEDLARELGVSVEEIHLHYEAALKELKPNARIKAFLPILAGRLVREIVLGKRFRTEISKSRPAPRI